MLKFIVPTNSHVTATERKAITQMLADGLTNARNRPNTKAYEVIAGGSDGITKSYEVRIGTFAKQYIGQDAKWSFTKCTVTTTDQPQAAPAPKAPRKRTVKSTSPADETTEEMEPTNTCEVKLSFPGSDLVAYTMQSKTYGWTAYGSLLVEAVNGGDLFCTLTLGSHRPEGYTPEDWAARAALIILYSDNPTIRGSWAEGNTEFLNWLPAILAPASTIPAPTEKPMSKRSPFGPLVRQGHKVRIIHHVGKCAVAEVTRPAWPPYFALAYRQFRAVSDSVAGLPAAFAELRHQDRAEVARDAERLTFADFVRCLPEYKPDTIEAMFRHHDLSPHLDYPRADIRRAITSRLLPKYGRWLSALTRVSPTTNPA